MAELRALLAAPDAQRVYGALGAAGWAARWAERDAQRRAEARAARARGAAAGPRGRCGRWTSARRRPGGDALRGQADGGRVPPGLGWLFAPEGPAPREPAPASGPVPRGQRPQILVTVPAGTLLGLGGEPAHLAGYGPIPDALARELAQDGVWRRVLTDPETGAVLDVGRARHDPPADLERFIRVRDAMCRFPGGRGEAGEGGGGRCGEGGRGAGLAGAGVAFRPGGARPPPAPAGEAGRQVRARPCSDTEWTSPLGAVHTTDPPAPGGESAALRGLAPGDGTKRARVALIDIQRRSHVEIALELAICA